MKKRFRIPIELFLSWCLCYSIIYTGKTAATDILLTAHSIFSLVLFILIYILLHNFSNLFFKTKSLSVGLTGLIFAIMMVLGQDIYEEGTLTYTFSGFLDILFRIFSLSLLFCILIQIFFNYLIQKRETYFFSKSNAGKSWKFFPLIWAIIFLCWFPIFLAFYPGIFSYDTPAQMWQVISHEYNTHHPLLHTLYMGGVVLFGASIKSYNFGIALYSLTQMLILSAIFSCICCYMRKWQIPRTVQIISVIFFSLHPVNSLYSISATKDVLFAGLIALIFAQLVDILVAPDSCCNKFFQKLFYIFNVLMLCLFRNNGIYVILFLLPFIFLLQKKQRKTLLQTTLVGIVLYFLCNSALTASLHATKGSVAEMLSVPIQQFALTYNRENLSPEDKEELTYYISEDTLSLYNGFISDPVKDGFNEEAFSERTKNFFYLWVKLGLQYPTDYIDAFLVLTLGNWYPDMNYPNIHPYMETEVKDMWGQLPMYRDSKLPWLEKIYTVFRTEVPHQNLPVISLLFSPGILIWIVILAISYFTYIRHKRFILPLCICIGLWGTNMLGPVALIRYVYPIFCCIPLIASEIILASRSDI